MQWSFDVNGSAIKNTTPDGATASFGGGDARDRQWPYRAVPGRPGDGRRLKAPAAAFGYMHGDPELHSPAPKLGQHTAEILEAIGYGAEEIAALGKSGVVRLL
jgi:hypothetical protein